MLVRPYEVSPERVDSVAKILAEVGMDSVFKIEEKLDPQYPAVRGLAMELGQGVAVVYAVLVALVSYRLAMKGEEWWQCFYDMLSGRRGDSVRELVDNVVWFLESCEGAAIRRDAKIARVKTVYRRARRLLEKLLVDPEVVLREPDMVAERLARALQVEVWRKTIVFSVKMAYYALGGPSRRIKLKSTIPIPVDVRVACISYTSGVVTARSPEEILRYPKTTQDAWDMVAEFSGIPPLHIDSVIWTIGGGLKGLDLNEARRKIVSILSPVIGIGNSLLIAGEMVWRPCS